MTTQYQRLAQKTFGIYTLFQLALFTTTVSAWEPVIEEEPKPYESSIYDHGSGSSAGSEILPYILIPLVIVIIFCVVLPKCVEWEDVEDKSRRYEGIV
jgi:hypothetical protein